MSKLDYCNVALDGLVAQYCCACLGLAYTGKTLFSQYRLGPYCILAFLRFDMVIYTHYISREA